MSTLDKHPEPKNTLLYHTRGDVIAPDDYCFRNSIRPPVMLVLTGMGLEEPFNHDRAYIGSNATEVNAVADDYYPPTKLQAARGTLKQVLKGRTIDRSEGGDTLAQRVENLLNSIQQLTPDSDLIRASLDKDDLCWLCYENRSTLSRKTIAQILDADKKIKRLFKAKRTKRWENNRTT